MTFVKHIQTLLMLSGAALQLLSAQSYTFSGVVLDTTTNTILEHATVYIVEMNKGEATDHRGRFSFNLPEGNYTVMCRLLGYTDQSFPLALTKDVNKIFRMVPAEIELSEVRVIGQSDRAGLTGSSQSVIVMTPQDVDRHRGQTIGKALESITGVSVLSTGPSIAKPVLRGLHSQRIRVLNAGVPQEGQQWGGEHAPEIDPFAPAQIEVLKGVAGVEYGAGAIGGVIKLQPRELRTVHGIGGVLSVNGFSNNRQGAGSVVVEGGPDLLENFSWRLQGSVRRAGNAQAPKYILGNTGFNESDASLAFGYAVSDVKITGYYSHFGTELGIYRGSHLGNLDDLYRAIYAGSPLQEYPFTYDIAAPKQEITHDLWSVNLKYPVRALGELELQYGWQNNVRQEYDGHTRSRGLPNFDLTLTTHSADLKFRHDPVGSFVGTVGVSGMRQGNVGQGLSFLIPNFRSYSAGLYFLETYTDNLLTLSAGSRFDYQWMKVFPYPARNITEQIHQYTNITGAVGTIYQFQPEWSMNINIGAGWRPPTVNELYSYGVHHGTAQFEIGDRNLIPEKSYSIDATLKQRGEWSTVEISGYVNRMDDFIFAFPSLQPTLTLRGIFPTMIYRQSNVMLYGLDASAEYQTTEDVRLGTSLSIVRGDDIERNEPVIQMPADRMKGWIHVHLPLHFGLEEAYVELTGTAVDRQSRVPANADYLPPPPGYVLFDVEYGGEFIMGPHMVRFNVSVQNIFNTAYRDYLSRFRYFIDNPGRDIIFRIQIPFGKSSISQ
jgi:iron complex outermembrane receptor protein